MATALRIRQPAPITGLRSSWPPDALEPTQSPRCLNVRFRFGEVIQSPGRSLLAGPAAGEDALHIGRFALTDGTTEWAMLATESGLFRWGASVPGTPRQWSRVTGTGLSGTGRYTVTAGEDFFFLARQSHDIMRWNGSGTSGYTTIPDGGTFPGVGVPKAQNCEYFNNRLLLGWTVEDGVDHANRLRWPVNATHTDWTGTGSGFLDLFEGNGAPITGLKGLGPRCAVYQPTSITDLIPTGDTIPVFLTETRVRGTGTRASYTIASTGQQHFFLGSDGNVYAWDGNQIRTIGDPILSELQGLVSPTRMNKYFGIVSALRGEYWLVLENGDVFIYDYVRDSWARDSFPDITALGEVSDTVTSETWNSITSLWSTETRTWAELGGASTSTMWAGRSDGATFAIDEMVSSDYFATASIVDRYCETPDWYGPNSETGQPDPSQEWTFQRTLMVYEYASADPFEVGLSVDRGRTWTTRQVTPEMRGYSWVDWNVTGNVCRFRFRENNAAGMFRWRSYQYEFVPGGRLL